MKSFQSSIQGTKVAKIYLQRLKKIVEEDSGLELLECQLIRGFGKPPQLEKRERRHFKLLACRILLLLRAVLVEQVVEGWYSVQAGQV